MGERAGDPPDAPTARFRSLADAYIGWHYAVHPTTATRDGIHDHDDQLGQWTREAIDAQLESLGRYERRFLAVDPSTLDRDASYDLEILRLQVAASILDLNMVRGWEKNPDFYREIISSGLYSLATLTFDTAERRIMLVTQRLRQVPDVLQGGRENLRHPPRIFVEIALEEFAGTYEFIKTSLPEAFASVRDDILRERFVQAQQAALEATQAFVDWLRKDLLPGATGEFALGADVYRRKVALEEGIDLPVDELLARGNELLRSTQAELKAVAGDRPVRALLRESARDHPPAGKLLAETQAMLDRLKAWASEVVTVPREATCRVQETPSFRRSLSFASMEVPGPFETVAREAYYSITLPDPSWTPERQEQHLSFFNRESLPLISVHEAFPGHYVHFLHIQHCPSRVRKVFGCGSFVEGWAHYCEQLYVERHPEEGPGLRLRGLQLSLVRICRYLAGIQMHAKGMSVEQAVELFVNEAYLERAAADREARRGTSDPTYLVYTLGKVEILKLRAEYLARTGGTEKAFHDDFLRTGAPPIPIARKILFGER